MQTQSFSPGLYKAPTSHTQPTPKFGSWYNPTTWGSKSTSEPTVKSLSDKLTAAIEQQGKDSQEVRQGIKDLGSQIRGLAKKNQKEAIQLLKDNHNEHLSAILQAAIPGSDTATKDMLVKVVTEHNTTGEEVNKLGMWDRLIQTDQEKIAAFDQKKQAESAAKRAESALESYTEKSKKHIANLGIVKELANGNEKIINLIAKLGLGGTLAATAGTAAAATAATGFSLAKLIPAVFSSKAASSHSGSLPKSTYHAISQPEKIVEKAVNPYALKLSEQPMMLQAGIAGAGFAGATLGNLTTRLFSGAINGLAEIFRK